MNTPATPLNMRVVAFVLVFVLLSGILGPVIIQTNLLYDAGFWIYGAAGKSMLCAIIALAILARDSKSPELTAWHPRLLSWAALCALCYLAAGLGVSILMQQVSTLWTVLTHAALVASVVFAGLAVFGRFNLRLLTRVYHTPLLLAGVAAGLFMGLLGLFYAAWEWLAGIVLHAVSGLLVASGLTVTIMPPQTLLLDKFGITIAQSCSGVESLALFTGLYLVIALVDRHRLNWQRFIGLFPLALLGLLVCNILRVYALIMGGYYGDPHIAFSLFHTYAGMLFFILYAIIFWKISYRWCLRKKS